MVKILEKKLLFKKAISLNGQCSICGGIFDQDEVCNIGLHVDGQDYLTPVLIKKNKVGKFKLTTSIR